MAATSLYSIPNIKRKDDQWLLQSSLQLKNDVQFLVHFPYTKYTIKLYNVPCNIVSKFCAVKCFATKGSTQLQGTHKEGDMFGAVSPPNNLARSSAPDFELNGSNSAQLLTLEGKEIGTKRYHIQHTNQERLLAPVPPDDMKWSMTLLDSSSDPMNDFEKQLQEFFLEVKAMLKRGDVDGATNILQANYEAVKEQIDGGAKGVEQAAILDIIAMGYMGIGDYDFVEYLLKMLKKIVGNVKNDEAFLDSVLLHMGAMYANLRKYEDAMTMYERSFEILEGLFGRTSPFLIPSLMGMAKVYSSIGRASKAVETYNQAVNILEKCRGIESEDVMVPLLGLGNLYIKEGKAADAEKCFNRILTTHIHLYGEYDGRVGIAMCSLANAKCAKGNLDEAIELYRKGLQVIENSENKNDEVTEKIRVDLADLYHIAGREKEGRELLKECLLITEKYRGIGHPSSVTHLLNLATSYSRSKNFVEAERLQRESLRILGLESEDPSISVPMLSLAITLYHLKRDIEAEDFALEALKIRERAFGDDSLLVAEALDCLVSIQTRLGKDETEVLALLKRVLSIQEKEMGSESEEVVTTLKKILFYLDKMGRKDEKLFLQRRLSMLRTKFKKQIHY